MAHRLYVVGENTPGYLPESDPADPMDWNDAADTLAHALRGYAGELAENADPDPAYEEDLMTEVHTLLWDGLGLDILDETPRCPEQPDGVEIVFEGRVFFIHAAAVEPEDLKTAFASAMAPLTLAAPTESASAPDGGFRASLWLGPAHVADVSVFPDGGPIRLLYRANEKAREDGTIRTWWMSNDFADADADALRKELGL